MSFMTWKSGTLQKQKVTSYVILTRSHVDDNLASSFLIRNKKIFQWTVFERYE